MNTLFRIPTWLCMILPQSPCGDDLDQFKSTIRSQGPQGSGRQISI